MADPEKIAESKRRYDARKPSLGFRAPDTDAAAAIVAASTEVGMKPAEWLREAAAEKLARQRRAKRKTEKE